MNGKVFLLGNFFEEIYLDEIYLSLKFPLKKFKQTIFTYIKVILKNLKNSLKNTIKKFPYNNFPVKKKTTSEKIFSKVV